MLKRKIFCGITILVIQCMCAQSISHVIIDVLLTSSLMLPPQMLLSSLRLTIPSTPI